MLTHPSGIFHETTFRPLGVLPHQIFLHTYNPLNCISSRIWGTRQPQVGLCLIFLFSLDYGVEN